MLAERRSCRRHDALATPWRVRAVLRSGVVVRLLNVARGGALAEASVRLRPGTSTTIHLDTGQHSCVLLTRITRCRVSRLTPLRYEAAFVFASPLEGLMERLPTPRTAG